MVELIVSTCLIADPSVCMFTVVPIIVDNRRQCNSIAMPQIAQWAGDLPEWRVTGWRCTERPIEEASAQGSK